MKLERDGISERTADNGLKPAPVLAEKFLNGHGGRREQQLDGLGIVQGGLH